jgi:hypothetical protein
MGLEEVAAGDEGLLRRHKIVSALVALTLMLVGVWGTRLWQVRQEVARYRLYWSVPRGESGGIVYVALGDSTGQGIGASSPERGYVGLIAQRLRVATHRPVQVINLSVTGARVRDVVAGQLPKLAGMSADVVTVAVGANDVREYDAARFRTDVDALCRGSCTVARAVTRSRPRATSPTWPDPGGYRWRRSIGRRGNEAGRGCSPTSTRTGSTPATVATAYGLRRSGRSWGLRRTRRASGPPVHSGIGPDLDVVQEMG